MGLTGIIIALVAIGAMTGGAWWTGHEGAMESQKQHYEPIVARAQADKEVTLSQNKTLVDERAVVTERIRACNQATESAKADTGIAVAMMAKVLDESQKRVQQFAAIQARFDAAARTTTPVSHDLSCEAARATLVEYSDQAHILDALGLGGQIVTTPIPPKPTLTITAPPKSAIKTLPGAK